MSEYRMSKEVPSSEMGSPTDLRACPCARSPVLAENESLENSGWSNDSSLPGEISPDPHVENSATERLAASLNLPIDQQLCPDVTSLGITLPRETIKELGSGASDDLPLLQVATSPNVSPGHANGECLGTFGDTTLESVVTSPDITDEGFSDLNTPSDTTFGSVATTPDINIGDFTGEKPLDLGASDDPALLPDAESLDLHLSHPTEQETNRIWKLISASWKDALSVPQFLEESAYLMTIPLAKDNGMTLWILVDKTLPPDHRPLLASCESFRKRSLVSDKNGNVIETITHGIASVYCNPRYRGRGYASRLLRELSKTLPNWQIEQNKPVIASVLFSDIGKQFYAALGWDPFPSYHIEFNPVKVEDIGAAHILATQVGPLCEEDEAMSRQVMAQPYKNERLRFMILPDHAHMLWHHRKEEFGCEKLFGKQPHIKGAIAGDPGNRVWAIWTHRFYGSPSDEYSGNTLYILRLVIENSVLLDNAMVAEELLNDNRQVELPVNELRAVLQAAQAEAADWKLQHVKMWSPSMQVEKLIRQTGLEHRRVDREKESICCLRWYGEGTGGQKSLDWIGNEKYGWC
ncbi:hypothetical protein PRK78_002932 [Emydomyces testavorans]|uniref:N-acetyltransferase domain-containing protein n=1 Tax=Emydomyces testavorans TaxID=2070801 RepID=A0AAF0DF69_9EURO|nr:hypothetical protein PRK78_002932 [Emydomyces testavorans]